MTDVRERTRQDRWRKLTIDAAVVAGAAVLAAVGIWIGTAQYGTRPMPNPNGQQPAARPAAPGSSVCGLAGSDPAGATVMAPPAATWTVVGTMAVPTSRDAGPGRTKSNGLRSCFAHTAVGALFAVANVWAMGSDPRLYRSVLEDNTATGEGRKQALQESIGPSNTGMSAQIAGFKVTSYTPEAATVDLVFQLSSGSQISFPAPAKWEDGDWKVELADNGTPVFRPAVLQSLTGYVAWAATR